MDMLNTWWPLLVVVLLVVVVVRRVRGEPLDLKDAIASPVIMIVLGVRALTEVEPTVVDVAWVIALSVVSIAFGAARSASTVIEWRGEVVIQRYRWTTFALLVASLVAGAGLGLLAQQFGMHAEARPLTLTIGVGLAGEGLITLVRGRKYGLPMPWTQLGRELGERDATHSR